MGEIIKIVVRAVAILNAERPARRWPVLLVMMLSILLTKAADTNFPPEALEQLESQKAALNTLFIRSIATHFELRHPGTGTDYTETNVTYFEGNRFYYHDVDNEFAYDGTFAWLGGKGGYIDRPALRLTKSSPADSTDPTLTYMYWKFSYLDAASIYAPAYLTEVEHFATLEPLALYYLEHGKLTEVERDADSLRATFQVDDSYLVNHRKKDSAYFRAELERSPNSAQFKANELEIFERLRTMVPKRTVSLTLDLQHGYSVAEREDRTAVGQLIDRVQSDDWEFFTNENIWLPKRCNVYYFATPYSFKEFADRPLQKMTVALEAAEFTQKDIEFTLSDKPEYKKAATEIWDRTLADAKRSEHHEVMLTMGANGTLLRESARGAVLNRGIFWTIFVVILALPPLVVFIRRFRST